jgi:hypothetical protein
MGPNGVGPGRGKRWKRVPPLACNGIGPRHMTDHANSGRERAIHHLEQAPGVGIRRSSRKAVEPALRRRADRLNGSCATSTATEQNDERQTSRRSLKAKALAQIDTEEIDPILGIMTGAA